MGSFLSAAQGQSVGLYTNDKPNFKPAEGFGFKRKPRTTPCTKIEEMKSARIAVKDRDYCVDYLMDYRVCRYKHMPWVVKCHHEKHAFLNCQHEDYVLRMKEFERERRLRVRNERIRKACKST